MYTVRRAKIKKYAVCKGVEYHQHIANKFIKHAVDTPFYNSTSVLCYCLLHSTKGQIWDKGDVLKADPGILHCWQTFSALSGNAAFINTSDIYIYEQNSYKQNRNCIIPWINGVGNLIIY